MYVLDRPTTFGAMIAELVEILAEDGGGDYVLGDTGRDPDGTVKISFTRGDSPVDPAPLRNVLSVGRHCHTALSEIRRAVELLDGEDVPLPSEQRSSFGARLTGILDSLRIVNTACTDKAASLTSTAAPNAGSQPSPTPNTVPESSSDAP